MIIGMIPARLGSQRLAKKNLRTLAGVPLIQRAIRNCRAAGCFDEIWVNSESEEFAPYAAAENVGFHKRPELLGTHTATSEDFVEEFLNTHSCSHLVQVHSIAPLLTVKDMTGFVTKFVESGADCFLGVEEIQIECLYDGQPVNFTYGEKTNSQDLKPIERVSWSITGWKAATFLAARQAGQCATYAGKVECYPLDKLASHVIKTEHDLAIAEQLLALTQIQTAEQVEVTP